MKTLKIKATSDIPDYFTGTIEYPDGTKVWLKNGKRHRTNGPAIIRPNGAKYWLQNGKYHRLNGPAYETPDGHKEWCQDGKVHRADGPAIEYANGNVRYFIDDEETYKEAVEVFRALFPEDIKL
jgi:hypothetical protein